jgi:hypothetical protein
MAWLEGSAPLVHAAVWALAWINETSRWHPSPGELENLIAIAARPQCEPEALFWFARIFGQEHSSQAVEFLLPCLGSDSKRLRKSTAKALGRIGDIRAVDALLALLADKQAGNDMTGSLDISRQTFGSVGIEFAVTDEDISH